VVVVKIDQSQSNVKRIIIDCGSYNYNHLRFALLRLCYCRTVFVISLETLRMTQVLFVTQVRTSYEVKLVYVVSLLLIDR